MFCDIFLYTIVYHVVRTNLTIRLYGSAVPSRLYTRVFFILSQTTCDSLVIFWEKVVEGLHHSFNTSRESSQHRLHDNTT